MPTVLRVDGFQVRIFPNDHSPPHVHVYRSGAVVVVDLASQKQRQTVREVWGMTATDVVKAFRIVEEHSAFLRGKWEELHG